MTFIYCKSNIKLTKDDGEMAHWKSKTKILVNNWARKREGKDGGKGGKEKKILSPEMKRELKAKEISYFVAPWKVWGSSMGHIDKGMDFNAQALAEYTLW